MKNALSYIILLAKVIFLTGWILPLYASIKFTIDWCALEASPIVYHTKRTGNSFPFLDTAERALGIACIWLILVFVYIAIVIHRKNLQKK